MESNRRRFFQAAGAGVAGVAISGSGVASASSGTDTHAAGEDGPVLQIGDDIAVAETRHGKVRGYVLRGIHYFLGIPYGADTSGANRFMPPQKPKPWTDVLPALWWGNTAPQNMDNRYANQYGSFRDHWNYDDVSEDCLRLNVFTPAARRRQEAAGAVLDPRRRLHQRQRASSTTATTARTSPGSATSSSAPSTTASGPLGYCNLAGVGGEKFAASGNVGMLDIVAALEWVRDNIAQLRRRSRQRDDHGPVRRRREGLRADGDARRPRASSTRRSSLSGASLRDGRQGHRREARRRTCSREAGSPAARSTSCSRCPGRTIYEVATKAQRRS